MQSQVLEQILEPVQRPEKVYVTIDLYTSGQFQMYTGQFKPINPIGSMGSGFQLGNPGNILKRDEFGLQERYDFSGHNGLGPHLNYDIFKTHINLGPAHRIDLFKK